MRRVKLYSLDILDILLSQFSTSPLFCPAYRFLRRQVRSSGIPISLIVFQFVVIHTDKGFRIVNETEVDAFLDFS